MAEDTVHEFDDNAIDEAVGSARAYHQEAGTAPRESAMAESQPDFSDSGQMELAAQCIDVTVANKKICVKLPKVGKVCLPVPGFVPNGTVAQACISVCTKFGIPTGVRLTVTVAGKVILRKTFGVC